MTNKFVKMTKKLIYVHKVMHLTPTAGCNLHLKDCIRERHNLVFIVFNRAMEENTTFLKKLTDFSIYLSPSLFHCINNPPSPPPQTLDRNTWVNE